LGFVLLFLAFSVKVVFGTLVQMAGLAGFSLRIDPIRPWGECKPTNGLRPANGIEPNR
jgi:hypothetical protein